MQKSKQGKMNQLTLTPRRLFLFAIVIGLFASLVSTAATEWLAPVSETVIVDRIGKGARGLNVGSLFYDALGHDTADTVLEGIEQATDDLQDDDICDLLFDGEFTTPAANEPSTIIAYAESRPGLCRDVIINNGFDYDSMRVLTVEELRQIEIDEAAVNGSQSAIKVVQVIYNWPNLSGAKQRHSTTDTESPCEPNEYYQLLDLGSFNNKAESAKTKNGCNPGKLYDFTSFGGAVFTYSNFANSLGAMDNEAESTKINTN